MRQTHRDGGVLGHDPWNDERLEEKCDRPMQCRTQTEEFHGPSRSPPRMSERMPAHCPSVPVRISSSHTATREFSYTPKQEEAHHRIRKDQGKKAKKKQWTRSNIDTHTHTPTQSCRHLRNPVQHALTAAISGSLGRQPRTGIRSIVHTVPIWRRSTRRTARANVSANKTLTALNQSWLGQKGVPRS
ncbi:hypothetical protein CSPX01_15208 [Colletotrichum filicis]|nr:hypothetical protein CSPX01_15208 [Colletotrichum filicis]